MKKYFAGRRVATHTISLGKKGRIIVHSKRVIASVTEDNMDLRRFEQRISHKRRPAAYGELAFPGMAESSMKRDK